MLNLDNRRHLMHLPDIADLLLKLFKCCKLLLTQVISKNGFIILLNQNIR